MLGEFRILSQIRAGSGTQGTVYKAVCESDAFPLCPRGTVVALKSMPVAVENENAFEKLRKSVDLLATIGHPNVVRYLGCFVAQTGFIEQHVVIQEFLEGDTLAAKLASTSGGLDADEALRVVRGVVSGLAAAVDHGIIHRDVKPANVFLCSDGAVKMIDFEVSRRASGSVTTSSGNMVGSFDYMAPEFTDPAFCGDERSDIFSVGVLMHEAFTGSIPYPRGTAAQGRMSMSFFERWSRDENGELVNGGCRISYRIERVVSHSKNVVLKALAVDREHRFATFAEFAEALSGIRFRELKNGDARYLILQFIGKGGFGEVFKARRRDTGALVAVKHLLKPDYATRFYREARIMSELCDPCFVRFLDFITMDRPGSREAFLVMDFLPGMPGSSLRDAIRRSAGNGIEFNSAIAAFARYAHGLAVMHARGIYHRDIKPSNLYFPEGRPEEAAIMDFGIARDENGTKTNGQVPGTLDYMPPETAFGDTRGDATMDIYALGLCLYEALTGKKGFPSLPSGSAAFAQFFKRAREKAAPTFDDERVTSRPDLLRLLVHMTDPDFEKRMSSAEELERALKHLLDSPPEQRAADDAQSTFDDLLASRVHTITAATKGDDEVANDEADTGETQIVTPEQIAAIAKKAGKKRAKGKSEVEVHWWTVRLPLAAAVMAAFIVLAVFGFFVMPIVSRWFNSFLELKTPAPALPQGALAEGFGLGVEDFYGDDSVPIEQADALCRQWLAKRRPPTLSEVEYARLEKLLAEKREASIVRRRLDDEWIRMDAAAKSVVRTYDTDGVEAGDRHRDEWIRAWSGATREKVERAEKQIAAAREKRLKYDAAKALLPEAEKSVAEISRNYGIEDLAVSEENANAWRDKWRDRLPAEDYERLDGRLIAAHDKAVGKDRGKKSKKIINECRAVIDALTPVDTRMNRLAEAETTLKTELAAGSVDETAAKGLLAEIDRRRAWTVFDVENRSDIDLEIGGETVANGSSRLFVYTNAPPAGLAATHVGYEPLEFSPPLNGRRIRLFPEQLVMLSVQMKLPNLETGIVCRVDGIMVRGKSVRLVPGSHECIYSRVDYKDQSFPFRVEPNKPSTIPPPGVWMRTDEWLLRPRPVRVSIPKLAEDVTCTIDGASVTGSVEVMSGDHVCIFSRPDYREIRHDITVLADEPMALPAPYNWKATDGLVALVEAEEAAKSDNWNKARATLQSADVVGADAKKRKKELEERIDRRRRFIRRVDAAAAASLDARWLDVVRTYAELVIDGYVLVDEDRGRIDTAVKNIRGRLQMLRRDALRSGSEAEIKKIDEKTVWLDDIVKTLYSTGKRRTATEE